MDINEERNYVLMSIKWTKNALVFWGRLTADEEERSFGGYTDDIYNCEKYTLEEIKNESSRFYEYCGEPLYKLRKMDRDGTWAIRIEELKKLGRRTTSYVLD